MYIYIYIGALVIYKYQHTHIYTYIYIYIHKTICVLVCIYKCVDADVPPLTDGIKVQKAILPGFGFEASKEGVQDGGFVETVCVEGF